MAAATVKTGGIGLDARDFQRFAKALRKAEPVLAKQLLLELRAAGEIVAAEARVLATDASRTIPPSIAVRTSGVTVSVVAGGNGVPLAGLMELGNKGNTTAPATFRHPVFGSGSGGTAPEPWVDQRTHPYLLPALDHTAAAAEQAAVNALDKAISIIVNDSGD